jgi:hypothetical protein
MIHLLNETTIAENYDKFRALINQTFTDARLDRMNMMYDHFKDRMIMAPASSTAHFHNACAGGYLDHVLRVTQNAVKLYDVWKDAGVDSQGYTLENVIFTAIHHDLGKLGSVEEPHYIPNDSQWHVENQGKVYKTNPNIHWMNMSDRSWYLLNYFGIETSECEWIGIRLTDGLYDESNKPYFITYGQETSIKVSLPFILHHADLMAARFENERWLRLNGGVVPKPSPAKKHKAKKPDLSTLTSKTKLDFGAVFSESKKE